MFSFIQSNFFKLFLIIINIFIITACNKSIQPEKEKISITKYYGVDSVGIEDFGTLKYNLGDHINLIILQIDGTDTTLWKKALSEAENNNIKLILWPIGYGHQWTTWHWKNDTWDISEGLDILNFSEKYIKNGGKSLEAVVMTHEPYWNNGNPFTTNQIKKLYFKLKEKAPNVKLFNYINDLANYNQNKNSKIEQGVGDILATWWHYWGSAEGGNMKSVLNAIDDDIELIKTKNLDVKLLFAIQCFGWQNKNYRMPSVSELKPFCEELFNKNELDGVIWYSWGKYSYDKSLKNKQYDSENKDRWELIKNLKFN